MQKESKDFLFKLLETPSPSGFEQPIQRVVKRRMTQFADDITIDVHGNLIAAFNPEGKIRVMLAGHCDQIGMMVQHIDNDGFIYVESIGGIDPAVLPGSNLVIHADGGPIPAVIGYPPVHLVDPADRGKKLEMKGVWVDTGLPAKEVKQLVQIGDPITYKLGVTELGKNVIASPGCDDRVGLFVVMEALRLVAAKVKGSAKKKFPVALYSVSTVQEEVGLRGAKTSAHAIDPHVGIALDVTHASDNPGASAKRIGTCNMGGGPAISRGPNINPVVEALLVRTAKQKKIPYQMLGAARATGTDANMIQLSRSGVAAALVGLPNRYMHTQVEVCDTRDLEAAARLIAEAIMNITPRMSFIPS